MSYLSFEVSGLPSIEHTRLGPTVIESRPDVGLILPVNVLVGGKLLRLVISHWPDRQYIIERDPRDESRGICRMVQ